MTPQLKQQSLWSKKVMELFPSFSFSLILTELLLHLGSFTVELIAFFFLWFSSQFLLNGIKSFYKK